MLRRLIPTLLLVLAAGCEAVQTTQPGTVGVERRQNMLVSSEQVNKSAADAYQKVLADAKAKGQLDTDPAALSRVRTVAQRLIAQTGAFRQDAPSWKWETHVITSNEVYTGLLQKLQVTDAELANVMGHEIGHALREHGRERASQQMAQGVGIAVVGAVLGLGEGAQDLSQMVLDLTFNLPHSRKDETEADRIGVELAARAGYDPHAAVSLWQKMGKLGGSQPPQFLSTHPSNENRLADLKGYSDKVMPLYQAAIAKR
jgi:predicted Zn-dependent protease